MAWNQNRNDQFMVDLHNYAQQLRQLTIDGYLLLGRFEANGVANDPAFVDARGVSKDDATAMVGVVADIVSLVRDGPVTQADREAVLSRILGGPLT